MRMRYETGVQHLGEEDFKRSTGVQRSILDLIRQVIEQELGHVGRPPSKPGRSTSTNLDVLV